MKYLAICSSPAAACLFFALVLCLPVLAQAATLNVPAQYTTIQAAVNAAQSGDTVQVADGTYSGPGNRDIDFNGKNLIVISQHGAANTIIDCGGYYSTDGSGNHRGFYLHSGETSALISGFTVKNGYMYATGSGTFDTGTGGGVCISGSSAVIQNCIITANTASVLGGGICSTTNGSRITLNNCTITNNAGSNGGGVYNTNYNYYTNGGTITVTDCTISGNRANGNGGGILNDNPNGGTIIVATSTITGNTASRGGGIFNTNYNDKTSGDRIMLTNCRIDHNSAEFDGGGINNHNTAGDTIALTNCTITENTTSNNGSGGGILNENYNGGITTLTCSLPRNLDTLEG